MFTIHFFLIHEDFLAVPGQLVRVYSNEVDSNDGVYYGHLGPVQHY